MAVGYYSSDTPEQYGLPDWWHDADGKVNYSWDADTCKYFASIRDKPIDFKKLYEEQDNSYDEDVSEEALDNLSWGRNHRSARIDGFREWEYNEEVYN